MTFAWSRAAAEICRGEDFLGEIWNPAPGLLVTRIHGRASVACLRFYARRAEREMGAGKLTVFHDWEALESYDAEARDGLKSWAKAQGDVFGPVHYLVRSKVISMLVSVAALTLGRDLHATTDRAAFLADLERALGSR
ncbi:MAG: hypothetical protein H6711_03160 [Myxococcales bacterium]|nr:hypothetical protein [Myxococcales bacterium]